MKIMKTLACIDFVAIAPLCICLLRIGSTSAHSWIACSDYDVANEYELPRGPAETDPARRIYDPSKCRGYPRGWKADYNYEFGKDFGFNYLVGSGSICEYPSHTYTAQFPKATYNANSRVCLAYPSKNHVASATTDKYMPDRGMQIYRTNNANTNPSSLSDMVLLPNYNGVHQQGVIDYKGFQSCSDFDSNNDKSLCTVCFDVDSPPPGEYSFIWMWKFNTNEVYTTCWDADIVTGAPVDTPDVPVLPSPVPDVPIPQTPDTCAAYYHQCGGKQWKGSTQCCDPEQECVYKEPYWSACHWKDKTRNCADHNGQCGGKYYQGPTRCCNPKQRCVRKSRYRSKCV